MAEYTFDADARIRFWCEAKNAEEASDQFQEALSNAKYLKIDVSTFAHESVTGEIYCSGCDKEIVEDEEDLCPACEVSKAEAEVDRAIDNAVDAEIDRQKEMENEKV